MTYEDLYHWGISGQKWGQRRYQNPDGTYTEIGKVRKNASRSNVSDDYKRSRSKKNAKTMSNEELRFATERRNLENQYKNSKHPKYDSTTIGRGQKFLAGLAGFAASAAAVKKAYSPVIKPAVDKFLNSVGKIPVVDKVLDSVGKTVFKKGIVIM